MKTILTTIGLLSFCCSLRAATYSSQWQLNGGVLSPRYATSQTVTSNLLSFGTSTLMGPLITVPVKQILSVGTNQVIIYTNTEIKLLSASADPSLVILQLGHGTNTGHKLFLSNTSTNAGFTLPSGSTNLDGGHVYLSGNRDWVPSNTFDVLFLTCYFPDWVEVNRNSPTNGNGGLVLNTPGYIPVTASSTTVSNSQFFVNTYAKATLQNSTLASGLVLDASGSSTIDVLALAYTLRLASQTGNIFFDPQNSGNSLFQYRMSGLDFFFPFSGGYLGPKYDDGYGTTANYVLNPPTSRTNAHLFEVRLNTTNQGFFVNQIGAIAISGTTNLYTDNGTSLLRNGVALALSGGNLSVNQLDATTLIVANPPYFDGSNMTNANGKGYATTNQLSYTYVAAGTSVTVSTNTSGLTNIYTISASGGATPSYTLPLSAAAWSPAGSTLYHLGYEPQISPSTSSATHPQYCQFAVPLTGNVKSVYVHGYVAGVLASSETITMQITNLTQATSVNLTSMPANVIFDDAATTGLSFAVTTGDFLAIRMTTPAWSTNVTNFSLQGILLIQ
jgi:hypothetical protein